MPLKYRDQAGAGFPPNGYVYFQPQTNWWSTPGLTFWQTVDEIVAMRKKNQRPDLTTDREAVANELDWFTCVRLKHNGQWCTPPTGDEKKNYRSNRPSLSPRPGRVAAAAGRVGNAVAGVGVVLDWLGDSLEPVESELAGRRARICESCPKNNRADWLQRIEGAIASGLKDLIELSQDLALRTTSDDLLYHCQVCDCALKLKVHVKLDHILAHTSERQMGEFPDFCWIKTGDKPS